MSEVAIVRDEEEGGRIAADLIATRPQCRPDLVLGLATGSTPLGVWTALAERQLDMSRVRGFALYEYIGLKAGHPQSYRAVVDREIVHPLGLDPSLVRVPGEDGGPLAAAGERYEAEIAAAGGVDVQILGIGRSGHIGFNEPGSSLASRTRIKALAESTRTDNARFFSSRDEVPTHCVTQGLGTILEARTLVLLAYGTAKARAIAAAVEGPVTASVPASVIQLHPHVVVIVDEDAASGLDNADYYRFAWDHRNVSELTEHGENP